MNQFQQILYKVLSDPSFKPPECLLDLNHKGDFQDLLESCSSKVCVRFSVDEAWLVLPIFESKFPDDSRPRKAIEAAASVAAARAVVSWATARAASDAASDAATVAWAVGASADAAASAATRAALAAAYATTAAYHATTAARNVRRSNSSITCEDQLQRLFNIIRSKG